MMISNFLTQRLFWLVDKAFTNLIAFAGCTLDELKLYTRLVRKNPAELKYWLFQVLICQKYTCK